MATDKKLTRNARKRSAASVSILRDETEEGVVQDIADLADDHDFLAFYETCSNSIGLLFCLTVKRLFGLSFSTLYTRSQKRGWTDLFVRERRNLKPNVNSIEKCFMLNRLIAEQRKNSLEFTHQATQLYEEIKALMTCNTISYSDEDNLYETIEIYRTLQCRRRFFYISSEEVKDIPNVLSLQRSISTLCTQVMGSCVVNKDSLPPTEHNRLKKLLQHSFIIVIQPSTPECVAAIKYEKFGNYYAAKINLRIVCLLDSDEVDAHLTLSPIVVTLHSLDSHPNEKGEIQSSLLWRKRRIFDEKGNRTSFYYTEMQDIKLMKSDFRSSRPFYNSKVCQLHFQVKIKVKNVDLEEDLTFLSQPFGICSHAQYFPEYVAKVMIYEIERLSPSTDRPISPQIVAESVCRYHIRITGTEPKSHTKEFILQQLQAAYEAKKASSHFTSTSAYEEILSKLINQLECFVDHPYLSMMYNDNLFLGICDSRVDEKMNGTFEEPQILLRFNALAEHHLLQQASVRYIVHNGQLIKATFHTKAFVDEMCRMICESNSEKAKSIRILSTTANRYFHDFSLYFDDELYRLSTISPPSKETYYPLIPVLWSTMRPQQVHRRIDSSSDNVQSSTLSISSASPAETSANQSTDKPSKAINSIEKTQADHFVHYLVEKLPELCLSVQTTTSLSTKEATEEKQRVVTNLLRDYFQKISQVQL